MWLIRRFYLVHSWLDTSHVHISILDLLHIKPVENCLNQRLNCWPAGTRPFVSTFGLDISYNQPKRNTGGASLKCLLYGLVRQTRVSLLWFWGWLLVHLTGLSVWGAHWFLNFPLLGRFRKFYRMLNIYLFVYIILLQQ